MPEPPKRRTTFLSRPTCWCDIAVTRRRPGARCGLEGRHLPPATRYQAVSGRPLRWFAARAMAKSRSDKRFTYRTSTLSTGGVSATIRRSTRRHDYGRARTRGSDGEGAHPPRVHHRLPARRRRSHLAAFLQHDGRGRTSVADPCAFLTELHQAVRLGTLPYEHELVAE